MADSKHKEHVQYQQSYFDSNCDVFRQPIPDDVVDRTRQIVAAARLGDRSRVLDVGTGMGVLIPHFLDAGVKPENVVGCDLSTRMLAEARRRQPAVTFWQGDFAELPADLGRFDAVFFNACFGNFFEQAATVNNASALLKPAGRIVISHPMGNRFVVELKSRDPKLVLHPLPPKHELDKWCENFNLRLETFRDEPDLYVAVLQSLLGEGTGLDRA